MAKLAKVKVYNTRCPPLVHNIIVEKKLVGQAWFTLDKSMLTAYDHLLVLHMFSNSLQEDLLHNCLRN